MPNLLLYAVNQHAERHDQAASWLTEQLNGPRRVGFPWQSIDAFPRISTDSRAHPRTQAPHGKRVTDWLAAAVAWRPEPGSEYRRILGELIRSYGARAI